MKNAFQILTNGLLAGILVVLFLILRRMPPTFGDYASAKGNRHALVALAAKQPVVRANLDEPITVDVDNPVTLKTQLAV